MKPDSGVVKIFGQQMNEALKDQIGYLPEERGLYKRLTAIELILYLASLKGMDKATAEIELRRSISGSSTVEVSKKGLTGVQRVSVWLRL